MALAALALTASTLTWTAGSWVQARYIARWGPRRLVRPGLCLVAIGLGVMCVGRLLVVFPALAVAAWALAGAGIGTALRSADGDHARRWRRARRAGQRRRFNSAMYRVGHRHRSGGSHRGRRFPDRAPPRSRTGVPVRHRGRFYGVIVGAGRLPVSSHPVDVEIADEPADLRG